ncbi:MAG TPA: HAMP domain-containing sensor histidine kinase [Candidatus Acidoferrum sp.]|nr:HAMP domain-containing sensor histidine kinase [Candidatus Acidoferrum sp.]
MKNKLFKGRVYTRLIHRIFMQTLLMFFASVLIVFAVRSAGRGTIGNLIAKGFQGLFGLDWYEASRLYQMLIRNNLDTILMLTAIGLLFVFFRVYLTWFMRYFDEIVAGVDLLSKEGAGRIVMSPELRFMEEKLNQVKDRLERRAKEARDAEARKNDLVMYLAHDIKTPLTSVVGYLSLLDETPDLPAPQKAKYIRVALEKAGRLEQLIGEFFEITRLGSLSLPLNKARIDLYTMLAQMADEAYPQLAAVGKRVEIEAAEDIALRGDPDKLARVFNNLLKNAVSYGEPDSVIRITAQSQGKNVDIRFVSAGEIPPDKLEVIFEKFCRLDAARSTGTGGAGLGLAIARDIVALHGGDIKAESGGGHTTFTLSLPGASEGTEK